MADASPRPSARGRSQRWIASLALLAAGWTALATGVISSVVIRDHSDSCGQPADLPSAGSAIWGVLAMVVAAAAIAAAASAWSQAGPRRAIPVMVGGALLLGAGFVLIVGLVVSHFQICF